jgi:hypothetical protein
MRRFTLDRKVLGRLLAAGVLLLGPHVAAHAQALTPQVLMQALAQQTSASARFVERKYIGFVDQPIESRGELFFTAPDRLEKRTLEPRQESLVLEGETLKVEQAGKRRMTVSLTSHPEAAAFVESIRGTLAGDLVALQKFYSVELSGNLERWKLVLVPLQERMQKIVTRIRIEGAASTVRSIGFDQADGDHSEMQITPGTGP